MQDEVKLQLRLPPDIRDWLADQAEHYGASINAMVVRALREKMDQQRKVEMQMSERAPINIRVEKGPVGYFVVSPKGGHPSHDHCASKEAAMEKARLLALSFGDDAKVLDLTSEP